MPGLEGYDPPGRIRRLDCARESELSPLLFGADELGTTFVPERNNCPQQPLSLGRWVESGKRQLVAPNLRPERYPVTQPSHADPRGPDRPGSTGASSRDAVRHRDAPGVVILGH